MEPAAPATADPISPSVDDFVTAWNEAASTVQAAWTIEEVPPVNEAGAFGVELTDDVQLTGVLNPSTDQVVEVTVILPGREIGPGRDHHGSDDADGDDHADGGHHGSGGATPLRFDPATMRNAVASVIRATSEARPEQVDAVLRDLGVEAAAELPASEADGELIRVLALERRIQLQRFPPVMVVSVRAEEPWRFPDSPNAEGTHDSDHAMSGSEGHTGHHGDPSPVAPDARRIDVGAESMSFDPAEIRVQAGEDIAIALTSDEGLHDFTIDELGAHVAAEARETTVGGFHAGEPGRYSYYCSIEGHREEGMEGTLVVE